MNPGAGIAAIMQVAPVIPVIIINDVADAVPMATARDWLALHNIRSVGGSWIVPAARLTVAAMTAIQHNAAAARAVRH